VIGNSLPELIGRTPLLRLNGFAPKHRLVAKCEFMNPLSIKDRAVLGIIRDAEAEGHLRPGDTIIEATSGNTGMALASLSARLGYRAVLVMSEIQSVERRKIMIAFGAELVLTPASKGTKGAKERLNEIRATHPEYFYLGQHYNPANPDAHYRNTGPEIWRDSDGEVDVLVAGLGTGGTVCGAGRYLKEQKPTVMTVGVEPSQAPFISKGLFAPHRIMGTAPGFLPETVDRELIDRIELIDEEEAFATCRELARTEGLLVGISSGATAAVARRLAQVPEHDGKCIVCVFADTGQRYLSVDGLFSQE
jgi:cysteine synthase